MIYYNDDDIMSRNSMLCNKIQYSQILILPTLDKNINLNVLLEFTYIR